MKKFQRMLALLLAALTILSTAALADGIDIDLDSVPTEAQGQTLPGQDPPSEIEAQGQTPAEDVPLEEVPAADAPAVSNADEEEGEPAETAVEQQDEEILAEAAGEAPGEEQDAQDAQDAQEDAGVHTATEEIALDGPSNNDALFQGYASGVLGLQSQYAAKNRLMGQELSGTNGLLYNALVPKIKSVAAGTTTGTRFALNPADIGATAVIAMTVSQAEKDAQGISERIGLNLKLVMETLISDYPLELYWFDKTKTFSVRYQFVGVSGGVKLTTVTMEMQVCGEYAADTYVLNAAKVDAVKQAAANARIIVNSYASKSDEEKIRGYVSAIGSLVSYNDAALKQADYGNPWQLVWVFDGNPGTNVVCEGYAKALKYLCDMTQFASGKVACYTMTGTVTGAASGAHMWNVVTGTDGRNYLVDATFTDGGYSGLVLAVPTKVNAAGKSYSFTASGKTFNYIYDSLSISVFPESVRTLATAPAASTTPAAVQSVSLGGTIYMVVGESRSLRPTYSPAGANPQGLAWATSNGKIVTVNGAGVIKAKKAGSATIAVRTGNGKVAYVAVKVYKKSKVKKVTLSRKGTLYMQAGTFYQLSAAYSPWNARTSFKGFKWSSNKKKIAIVNGSGLVYAKKKGKATITVKAGGKKAKVKIVVY